MGPALTGETKVISFLGVRGGVGCTFLSAFLGRLAAQKNDLKIAFLDASPPSHSPAPAYFSIGSPAHFLTQLLPYSDCLTRQMIESFFSRTPEGLFYLPVKEKEGEEAPPPVLFPLLGKLEPFFDLILVDLSGFPSDQHPHFLEKSPALVWVSSLEPSSLRALALREKGLLARHLDLKNQGLIFNRQNASQMIPRDLSPLTRYLNCLGALDFLGDDFIFRLSGRGTPENQKWKSLESVLGKTLAFQKGIAGLSGPRHAPPGPSGGLTGAETVTPEMVHRLHQDLLEKLRQSGLGPGPKGGDLPPKNQLEPAAKDLLDQLIQERGIPDRELRRTLASQTLDLAFGLGPLEPLLRDGDITEIMVNGPDRIYVEKKGMIERTDAVFRDDQQLRTVIERILAPLGRRIDESQPYVDGRLGDGSRVNAVIPPLSLNGPILTIRKFSKQKLTAEDLIRTGSLTREACDFLGGCVRARKNILVSGGTGSGKTTLLNILSGFIPPQERIVTIEDSAELQLSQDHVVRLESRPANLEGKGQVSIRDLVMNALRMRPNRIVVGECRGGEALDMLQAMNTGHDGSLTTAHANSPRDALTRLETMALFTGLELPLKALREQISRAIHLVVQQNRLADGKRGVTRIVEVQGMEGDVIITQDLFTQEEGKGLQPCPWAPSFIGDLNAVGYQWPGHKEKTKA